MALAPRQPQTGIRRPGSVAGRPPVPGNPNFAKPGNTKLSGAGSNTALPEPSSEQTTSVSAAASTPSTVVPPRVTSSPVRPSPNVPSVTPVRTSVRSARPFTSHRPAQKAKPSVGQKAAIRPESSSTKSDAQERRIQQLLLSRNMTREFVSTTDMTKLLSVIFDRILETLNAEAGSFWIADQKKQQNFCKLAEGPTASQVIGLRLPAGVGIVGSVIESRQAEIITDVTKDDRFTNTVDEKTGFATRSMICAALTVDNQTYGAIQVLNRKNSIDGAFNHEDLQLIEDLAMSAAISIKNARLLQTEQKVKEMSTLLSMSQQMTATLDIEHVLTSVTTLAGELVDIEYCAVALRDENRDKLFLAASSRDQHKEWPQEKGDLLLMLMKKAKEAGRSVYVADKERYRKKVEDPGSNIWLQYLDQGEYRALWMMPLKDDEGILGVMVLLSKEKGFASRTKADMLSILANQTTISLRNASLYQKIPFAGTLGRVGAGGRAALVSWRKWTLIITTFLMIGAMLHYAPFFRSVTGDVVVEAKLGQGLFLPVSGVIQRMYVREGQAVKADQPLFRLDDRDLRLTLIEAESKLAVLERQIIEARAKDDAAELSRHLIDRNSARAQVLKAREDLSKVTVLAPKDSIVLTPRTDELVGRSFNLGDEVLRLADPDKPAVIVKLAESDVLDVRVGQQVTAVLKARPGEYFAGKVAYIGRSFDVPTEALDQEVKSEMEEGEFIAELLIEQAPDNVQPGMTGVARIETPESSTLMRIGRRIRNFFLFWFGI